MIAKKAKRSGGFGQRMDYILEEVGGEQRGKFIGCSDDLLHYTIGDNFNLKSIDSNKVRSSMQEQASKNSKVEKPCYHQIFSFPDGERPNDEVLEDISNEFAKEFGFSQWLSVKHEDTKHLHIHFVGNIVNNQGKVSVNDSNDFYRINDFVKYVHQKHDLQKVGELKSIEKLSTNKHINRIKNIIDKALIAEGVNDIKTLQHEVLKSGIKSFTQRGISFIDNYSGVQFKGSALGKEYSSKNLERRISEKRNYQEKDTAIDPYLTLKMAIQGECIKAENLEDLDKRLTNLQMGVSLENNALAFKYEGSIVKERDLGEDYSMNHVRFNLGKEKWVSKTDKKAELKESIKTSLTKLSDVEIQSFDNFKDNLNELGWNLKLENKNFKNSDGNNIDYTQVVYQSKDGLKITDTELKQNNVTNNPYGFNGIKNQIEKINQTNFKQGFNKNSFTEIIKGKVIFSSNLTELIHNLKQEGVELMLSNFKDKETGDNVEILRFKSGNTVFNSKELGEDFSLVNLRYNLSLNGGKFASRTELKDELLSDIQSVFQEKNLSNDANFDQFSKDLNSRGWTIEIQEKLIKNDGNVIDYKQLKYSHNDNPEKYIYDYELKNKDEKSNHFSFKGVSNTLNKSKASNLRDSLVKGLESATSLSDLAYIMFRDSGILVGEEHKSFQSKDGKKIDFKEMVFYFSDRKSHEPGRDYFDNIRGTMLTRAELNNNEKFSLSQINHFSDDKKISNKDIREFFQFNRVQTYQMRQEQGFKQGKEVGPEVQQNVGAEDKGEFWEDIKKLMRGKISQSGHASVNGQDDEKDIRSNEEKRKDELRRQGKTL
jgi:hypothetical protein